MVASPSAPVPYNGSGRFKKLAKFNSEPETLDVDSADETDELLIRTKLATITPLQCRSGKY